MDLIIKILNDIEYDENDLDMNMTYGSYYLKKRENEKSLTYFEKALNNILLTTNYNFSDLATIYTKIGRVFQNIK